MISKWVILLFKMKNFFHEKRIQIVYRFVYLNGQSYDVLMMDSVMYICVLVDIVLYTYIFFYLKTEKFSSIKLIVLHATSGLVILLGSIQNRKLTEISHSCISSCIKEQICGLRLVYHNGNTGKQSILFYRQ